MAFSIIRTDSNGKTAAVVLSRSLKCSRRLMPDGVPATPRSRYRHASQLGREQDGRESQCRASVSISVFVLQRRHPLISSPNSGRFTPPGPVPSLGIFNRWNATDVCTRSTLTFGKKLTNTFQSFGLLTPEPTSHAA